MQSKFFRAGSEDDSDETTEQEETETDTEADEEYEDDGNRYAHSSSNTLSGGIKWRLTNRYACQAAKCWVHMGNQQRKTTQPCT